VTLIEVKTLSGRLVGRCDARCYNGRSRDSRCDCVCEGLNHGVGLEAALENVSRIRQEWRELYGGYEVKMAQIQLKLFE